MYRRLTILLVAVGLLVSSGLGFGGGGTNSSADVAGGNPVRLTSDQPSFGPITFSRGYVEGMDVIDMGQRFESGIATLYAQWPYRGVQAGERYIWQWHLDGKDLYRGGAGTLDDSTGKVTFWLELDDGSPLESGTHELRVFAESGLPKPVLTGEVIIEEPGTSVPSASPSFGPLTYSSDFDDDALEPVNAGEVFREGIEILYAYWPYTGVQPPQTFEYTWYHDGEILSQDESEFAYESGAHWTWYERGGEALEPGTYELVLTVDGEVVLRDHVTIGDAASPSFGPLTFSSDFDDDTWEPVTTGEAFQEGIQTLYSYWPYTGVQPPQTFEYTWYHDGEILWQEESAFPDESGGYRAWIAEPDGEVLEPGTYELVVIVDGAIVLRDRATIGDKAAKSSPTLSAPTGAAEQACAPNSAVAPADWPVVICDTFDRETGDWGTGPDDFGDLGIITRTIVEGGYTWEIEAYQDFWGAMLPQIDPVTDFYVAVDARRVSGPEGDTKYGVQFRLQDDDDYYQFVVSDFKDFALEHLSQGQWITLIDWTPSEAILPGDWNRVAVQAIGPDFTLYINDQEVAQFTDEALSQGGFSMVTQLFPGEETRAVVEFDNFEVRLPPGDASVPPGSAASPTQAPAPIPSPAPTVALGPADAPSSAVVPADWPLEMSDGFDNETGDWPTGPGNVGDRGMITRTIADGGYTWEVEAYQDLLSWVPAPLGPVTDFYVAVDAREVSGPESNTQYGVLFRKQDTDNYYMFLASDSKGFTVLHLSQGQWSAPIARTPSDAILPGERNRVEVQAFGPDVTLYINDQEVARFTDDLPTEGGILVATHVLPGEETRSVVEFDNFEVRLPPAVAATE